MLALLNTFIAIGIAPAATIEKGQALPCITVVIKRRQAHAARAGHFGKQTALVHFTERFDPDDARLFLVIVRLANVAALFLRIKPVIVSSTATEVKQRALSFGGVVIERRPGHFTRPDLFGKLATFRFGRRWRLETAPFRIQKHRQGSDSLKTRFRIDSYDSRFVFAHLRIDQAFVTSGAARVWVINRYATDAVFNEAMDITAPGSVQSVEAFSAFTPSARISSGNSLVR